MVPGKEEVVPGKEAVVVQVKEEVVVQGKEAVVPGMVVKALYTNYLQNQEYIHSF